MAALDAIRPVAREHVPDVLRARITDLVAVRRENASLREINQHLREDNALLGKYNAALQQELCRARSSH